MQHSGIYFLSFFRYNMERTFSRRLLMGRFVALVILLIPIFLAGFGIKLMRDAFFHIIQPPFSSISLQFLAGIVLFFIGFAFIGGFILHRDRKNGKVAPRFAKKEG